MLERVPEFVGNHPILSLLFIGLLGALIYTELSRLTRRFKEISPAELTRLINREDAAVLDVSAQNDFDRGHIVNATHMAASQVSADAKPLKNLKGRPLAVVCQNGITSAQVCGKLSKAGVEPLYCLKGGLQAWTADNLPVTKS